MNQARSACMLIGAGIFIAGAVHAQTFRPLLNGHHIPPGVIRLQSAGRLGADQLLDFTINLPLRDPADLSRFLQELSDPTSPNFRRYLTPEQFTDRYGPTKEDYAAVVAYAHANGFEVDAPDPGRVLVSVHAPVAVIEKAFHITMRIYKHPTEARNFFAPDTEPLLDLSVPVQDIGGLDNYVMPHPAGLIVKPLAQSGAIPADATPQSGSGPNGTYAGSDFRAAYAPGVTLTGMGQSLGLVEFGGYYSNDIVHYENTYLPGTNVPIVNVLLNGISNITNNANTEEPLDIELAISMAPEMTSIYFYCGTSIDTMLSRIASDNAVKQVSASWTYGTTGSTDGFYQQLAAEGITFFNCSGDSDAYPVGTSIYDCVSTPYVTCVGGTTLTVNGTGGSWKSEKVWNWGAGTGSGGGISTSYSIPSWQTGIDMSANQGSTTLRNIPDVALTGDNVYVWYNGAGSGVGGTSCATPLWAAYMALVNQQAVYYGQPPVGALNPVVYAIGKGSIYTNVFHDITNGNNFKTASPTNFAAVEGYDLCTGWGTPKGQATIDAILPPSSLRITQLSGFTSYGHPGGPFSVNSQSFVITNCSAQLSPNWSLSNTSTWLNVSSASGSLTPNASTNVTISLNPAVVANLPTGNYSANVVFSGQVVTQALTFTLAIGSFDVWTGGGTPAGNWNKAANWFGAIAPSPVGDDLVFAGSIQPVNTNNVVTSAGWILLNPDVAFTLFGSPLALTSGLTNSACNNILNLPLMLGANQNFDDATNTALTLDGTISDGGGGFGFMKTGSGTLTVNGVNTYSGGTILNGGTFSAGSDSAFGFGPVTVNTNAQIVAGNGSRSITNAVTLNAGKLRILATGSKILTFSGGVTLAADSFFNFKYHDSTALIDLKNNSLSGSYGFTLTDENNIGGTAGSPVLRLSVGGNTYAGNTTIASGTLRMNALNALPYGAGKGNVMLDGTASGVAGTLDLYGNNTSINGLSGANNTVLGQVTNSSSTVATLTVGNANTSSTFAGLIGGPLSLFKTGTGTLTMNGVNTYSGGTILNGGTFSAGSDSAFGSGPVTVNTNAQIVAGNGSRFITNEVTLNAGKLRILATGSKILTFSGGVTLAADSFFNFKYHDSTALINLTNNPLSGSYGFTLTDENNSGGTAGSPVLQLSVGGNTYAGNTTIASGTLQMNAVNALPYGVGKGNVILNGATNPTGTNRVGTLDLNGYSTMVNGLSGTNNTLLGMVTNSSAALATLTVGNANTSSTFAGIIAGPLSLNKVGTGTLTLSGPNTFTGNTTVSGGTLLVNGSLAAGAVTVAGGGTLGGRGSIGGATLVNGTFAPGISGIGQMAISNSLMLAGSSLTLMQISRNGGTPTNDVAFVSGSVTEGGTLTVSNIGTNALASGDSFKLFNATNYAGAFTNLILPGLTKGLYWNTNTLASSGTLAIASDRYTVIYTAGPNGSISGTSPQIVNYGASGATVTAVANANYYFANWTDGSTANPRTDANVTSNITVTAQFALLAPPTPTNISMAAHPPSFTLSGTGAANQAYVLLTATNLPPAAWLPVLTNNADTNGVFSFTDLEVTNYSQRFYRVLAQ